ncbi:MAG: glycoside hydrolase family 2 protein, partial [Verrucomicrobiota bacterium]
MKMHNGPQRACFRKHSVFQKCLVLALSCLVASVTRADNLQRLIPWSSLQGKPHPDEAELDTATWTTLSRESRAPRVEQTINQDWTFNYFPAEQLDTSLITASADDARWSVVALPHTWHTFETTREIHPFIARPSERDSKYWWYGWGVYRKTFVLDPKTVEGRRVFAEFDGVMKYCRVFLNGKELGDHKGGYGSFDFDLTSQLRPGTNVLAVAVNARRDDVFRIPPMTAGNFDVYGGIYRDVRLVVKSAVHIPFQGSAEHEGGTFVTTPQVSADRATVRVRTWVRNDDSQPRTVTLRTRLLDPAGRELAAAETNATVAVGEIHEFDQPQFNVAKPQLWSIETPTLYTVTSEVRVGKTLSDRYASPLGFRWFEWNKAENRAYLNGKQLHLHGSNRHQEFPWLGDAVPKWIHVRDMAEMRFGQNHNFLRTAHYTQDSLVYDLADRYGMLICEEVPNIKEIDFDEDVQRQQVIEMVRRDRNHPSIVMWSMGNETSDPADSAWAHAEDDTRLIHLRRSNSIEGGKFVTSTHQQIDMENLLRCTVRGWTDRDVMNLQPVNGQQAGTEEWQHTQAMVEGGSQRGRIDMANGNMWIYADHGADREYLNSPLKHINPKGWVDLYRIPKYMYFLWQANYLETPMVFIQPHLWQSRYVGQKKDIIVDSNCDSVELFVNGRSIGTQQPNAKNFWNVTFTNVPIERGELKAVAKKGGATVTSRVVMAGAPARLTLAASQSAITASRDSVAVLTVDVVDENGVPVPEFSRDLHWEVSGPAKLISPERYQSDIKRKEEMYGEFYIVTPVSAVLRATGQPGTITVTVKADGVAP